MNHKNKKSGRKPEVIRVWTYPQAKSALPYITSVMRSLREHWLDAQRHQARAKQLAQQPGRPDRARLLEQEVMQQEGQLAKDRFNETYEELQNIEVFCIDPNQGVAVVPFVRDNKLAWLIYDLFAADEFHHWRYHEDPLEKQRPIAEVQEAPPTSLAV
jgi:hypothetical protein